VKNLKQIFVTRYRSIIFDRSPTGIRTQSMLTSDEELLNQFMIADRRLDSGQELFNLSNLDFSSAFTPCLNASLTSQAMLRNGTMDQSTLKRGGGTLTTLSLKDLQLSDLLSLGQNFKGDSLDTPPVGDNLFRDGTRLLDREDSVNLNDLIGSVEEDDYFDDSLAGLRKCQGGEPIYPSVVKGEPKLSEEYNFGDAEEFSYGATTPGTDETFLPLPVIEEEVGSEDFKIVLNENLYLTQELAGGEWQQNMATVKLDDLSPSWFVVQPEDIPNESLLQHSASALYCVPTSVGTPSMSPRDPGEVERVYDKKETFKATSRSVKGRTARQRQISPLDKESDEYRDKRDRNNESVRKSRDKARQRQIEIEACMETLSSENRQLQDRVDSLEKELAILRGVFTSVGTAVPREIESFLVKRH